MSIPSVKQSSVRSRLRFSCRAHQFVHRLLADGHQNTPDKWETTCLDAESGPD